MLQYLQQRIMFCLVKNVELTETISIAAATVHGD